MLLYRRIQKTKKVPKSKNAEVLVSNVSGKCRTDEKLLSLLIAVDDDIPLLNQLQLPIVDEVVYTSNNIV